MVGGAQPDITDLRHIIARKRDGHPLTQGEIEALVAATVSGLASDAQLASFTMATLLKGMDTAETAALTRAMAHSGEVLSWPDEDDAGPYLDKHSTGGVGDKVSLVLAPLLAASGARVPMVSGRGLGHTGGTLDKLEAIAGYQVAPSSQVLHEVIASAGCAIVAASDALAPADRRLYAIRDMTATVESMPLIVSSILSKKLAAGVGALVLDVKCGSGAFLGGREQADALAASLVSVANQAGLPCTALVTGMDEVLGRTVGNALEVDEAVAFLRGEPVDARLEAVTLSLGAEVLCLGGLADTPAGARDILVAALRSGQAAERFERMVQGLGGGANVLERFTRERARAPLTEAVYPARAGFVQAIEVAALGWAVIDLGGGRRAANDRVDPRVGLSDVAGLGEEVGPNRPLAVVHAADPSSLAAARNRLLAAFDVGEGPRGVVADDVSDPVLGRIAPD